MNSLVPEINIASIPAAMKALDRLDVDIRNAPTLEILNALADAAAGLQRRWKPVKDVADRAGECWINAEVKRGEELAKIPKAKGGMPYQKRSTGSIAAPVGPTRAQMGVGKKEATRAEKIAAMPVDECNKLIGELRADGKAVTPAAGLAKKRAENKAAVRAQAATFADWFSELREISGERWAEIAEQAPTAFAIWFGGGTPEQANFMIAAILPPKAA